MSANQLRADGRLPWTEEEGMRLLECQGLGKETASGETVAVLRRRHGTWQVFFGRRLRLRCQCQGLFAILEPERIVRFSKWYGYGKVMFDLWKGDFCTPFLRVELEMGEVPLKSDSLLMVADVAVVKSRQSSRRMNRKLFRWEVNLFIVVTQGKESVDFLQL